MVDTYVDLDILGDTDDGYLVHITKSSLNDLVSFNEELTIRNWDGTKPVVLEPYGNDAVRTREDASEANNLSALPSVEVSDLLVWINS